MADIENPGGGGGGVVVDARPDPDRRCAPLLCMLGALIAFCILSMLFYRAHWAAGLGGGCGPAHPGGHGPWDSSSLACCCVFVVVEGTLCLRNIEGKLQADEEPPLPVREFIDL
ncbi:hypothetical protein SEVIR_5G469233v4 [Setaria viridis]